MALPSCSVMVFIDYSISPERYYFTIQHMLIEEIEDKEKRGKQDQSVGGNINIGTMINSINIADVYFSLCLTS